VTEAALASSLLRRYRIIRKLGAGGMGAVFLAEQIALGNRPVALKVLSRKLLDDPEFLERFHNEAASTARIRHPNVVTVYESGQSDDGAPYIAMEFLEGESLRLTLRTRGGLPLAECALILQQAARGLNAAHRLGIIHRDLKPDNIFLTYSDEGEVVVKVVDFGLAKLRESATHTLTGTVLGTPAYMSSEQAAGMRSDELDARSDIYSLGVVVYEMLTGRVPFHSDTPLGYVRKHVMDEPPPFRTVAPGLLVRPEVEATVMKALAKDRDLRYPSALEFARDFARAASAPMPADTPTPPGTTKRAEPFTPTGATGGLRGEPSVTPAAPVAHPRETAVRTPEFHGEAAAKTVRVEDELRTTLPPISGPRAEPQKVLPQPSSPPPLTVEKKSISRLMLRSLAAVVVLVIVAVLVRAYWLSPPKQANREVPASVGNNPPPNPPILERNPTQIVVSAPPNAQVYLDDAFKGRVNPDGRLVIEDPEAGEHNLKVTMAGRRDFEQQVIVTAGNVATVQATLKQIAKPPAPATHPLPSIPSSGRTAGVNPHPGTISRDDIIDLLNNYTASSDVVKEIEHHGINFSPTADDETKIRAAGGDDELIRTIREVAPHPQHGMNRKSKAITKQEIIELLQGQVASSQVASLVKDRGINFSPTTDDLNEIRLSGGDDGLIQAIQQAANASRN
jgi:serine/threonine protein kinase